MNTIQIVRLCRNCLKTKKAILSTSVRHCNKFIAVTEGFKAMLNFLRYDLVPGIESMDTMTLQISNIISKKYGKSFYSNFTYLNFFTYLLR